MSIIAEVIKTSKELCCYCDAASYKLEHALESVSKDGVENARNAKTQQEHDRIMDEYKVTIGALKEAKLYAMNMKSALSIFLPIQDESPKS